MTINAITQLYKEERPDLLITNRLNQDPIENFFSIVREKGGWCLNSTARAFRLVFRIQMVTNLLEPSKIANCLTDSDISLFSIHSTSVIKMATLE